MFCDKPKYIQCINSSWNSPKAILIVTMWGENEKQAYKRGGLECLVINKFSNRLANTTLILYINTFKMITKLSNPSIHGTLKIYRNHMIIFLNILWSDYIHFTTKINLEILLWLREKRTEEHTHQVVKCVLQMLPNTWQLFFKCETLNIAPLSMIPYQKRWHNWNLKD